MPSIKKFFQIRATNEPSTGFSHRAGNPTIKFSIPSQDNLLETSSLRVTGRLQVSDKANARIVDNPLLDTWGNVATDGTVDLLASWNVHPTNFGGVQNMIEKVVIQSKKSSIELVNESNYALYTALREGMSNNDDDMIKIPLSSKLSTGTADSNGFLSAHLSITPTDAASPDGKQRGQFFSLKLDIPFLKNSPIHLGADFTGGLMITIYLAPDNNALMSRNRNTARVNNQQQGSSYTLLDLRLTGRYQVPTAQDLKAYDPEMLYSSRVNFINDINSSSSSTAYTPQLQMVQAVINQIQRPDVANNFYQNATDCPQVMGLVSTTQSKNNLRYPFDYEVKVEPNYTVLDPSGLQFYSLGSGDAEVRLQHFRAILGGVLPYHSSISLSQIENAVQSQWQVVGASDTGLNVNSDLAGVACDYTNRNLISQNFVNQDYALELNSGIQTGNASIPAQLRNVSFLQQTFVKNYEVMDLQKLVKIM